MRKTNSLTDREYIDTNVRHTIESDFGFVLNAVQELFEQKKISQESANHLEKLILWHSEMSASIIMSHLRYYNITKNHRNDAINVNRAIRALSRKED